MPDIATDRSLVNHARRWVSDAIRDANAPAGDDDAAALVTSELVTNALMHGSRPFAVAVDTARDRTRVEVWDSNPGTAVRVRDRMPTVDDVGGWGLTIVNRLSDDWGVCRADDRKFVWAEFRSGAAHP
jgi:anti-sigma regulatory factor (Ser/Thr protein kinase)